MKSRNAIGLCIIIGVAALGVEIPAILFFYSVPEGCTAIIGAWAGIIGTVASVLLSIGAMIYSNKASEATEKSLDNIKEQYQALCTEIRNGKYSFGSAGVDKFIDKQKEIIENTK